jgi:hypothetical protein
MHLKRVRDAAFDYQAAPHMQVARMQIDVGSMQVLDDDIEGFSGLVKHHTRPRCVCGTVRIDGNARTQLQHEWPTGGRNQVFAIDAKTILPRCCGPQVPDQRSIRNRHQQAAIVEVHAAIVTQDAGLQTGVKGCFETSGFTGDCGLTHRDARLAAREVWVNKRSAQACANRIVDAACDACNVQRQRERGRLCGFARSNRECSAEPVLGDANCDSPCVGHGAVGVRRGIHG